MTGEITKKAKLELTLRGNCLGHPIAITSILSIRTHANHFPDDLFCSIFDRIITLGEKIKQLEKMILPYPALPFSAQEDYFRKLGIDFKKETEALKKIEFFATPAESLSQPERTQHFEAIFGTSPAQQFFTFFKIYGIPPSQGKKDIFNYTYLNNFNTLKNFSVLYQELTLVLKKLIPYNLKNQALLKTLTLNLTSPYIPDWINELKNLEMLTFHFFTQDDQTILLPDLSPLAKLKSLKIFTYGKNITIDPITKNQITKFFHIKDSKIGG